jgi:hypothetical protein
MTVVILYLLVCGGFILGFFTAALCMAARN